MRYILTVTPLGGGIRRPFGMSLSCHPMQHSERLASREYFADAGEGISRFQSSSQKIALAGELFIIIDGSGCTDDATDMHGLGIDQQGATSAIPKIAFFIQVKYWRPSVFL